MDEIELLKEQLKQTQLAYQMAAQMSQFKGGFLARTSHELRSPLTSLMGLHQLIINNLCESPEEEKQFILQAYESAQKLMKIIDEIVAISQVEYGTANLEIKSLQLNSIFEELELLTYLQATHSRIPIEIAVNDSELYVFADRSRLQQALLILIDGAISTLKKKSIQGDIKIKARADRNLNLVEIEIDINQCPANLWSEPVNLLEFKPNVTPEEVRNFSKALEISPGMKLMLCSNLLETMKGKLILNDLSSPLEKITLTQLRCSLPLAPQ